MLSWKRWMARLAPACLLFPLFAAYPGFAVQDHVVSPAEIHNDAVAATGRRERNVATVTQFMATPRAKQALASAHLGPAQVKTAMAKMSDEEVAELASRVDKTQADFAAGSMSDRDMIWLVLGIVVLILIIVAVR